MNEMSNNRLNSGKSSSRSPRFTDEELVLLMYFYLKFRNKWFSEKSPHIQELSRLYRNLPIFSKEERFSPTFRNPAGIYFQIRKFARCDPSDYRKQKLSPSSDMVRIWDEYNGVWDTLKAKVDDIISLYGINSEDYPLLFS